MTSISSIRCSVEVVAETLHEAAVLGIKAMNFPRDRLHLLSLNICVKEPEVQHKVTGAAVGACPAWEITEGADVKGASK